MKREMFANGIYCSVTTYIPSCINVERVFFQLFPILFLIQLVTTPLFNKKNPRIKKGVHETKGERLVNCWKQNSQKREMRHLNSVKVGETERVVGEGTSSAKPSFLG